MSAYSPIGKIGPLMVCYYNPATHNRDAIYFDSIALAYDAYYRLRDMHPEYDIALALDKPSRGYLYIERWEWPRARPKGGE